MLVTPTTTIQLDDQSLTVANLSPGIQQMVQVLDTWRQEEVDAQLDLMKVRAAITDIQNQLGAALKKEQDDAAAAAAAAATPAANDAAPAADATPAA